MQNEEFTVPCMAAYEFVTPESAKQMLGAGNRKNRKVTSAGVKRLQGIIARDEWMYDSTDAIGLDSDGGVVNGQHRLTAIAEGSAGVWMLVVRGVRPDIIKVIDQGIGRSLAQALDLDGRFPKPTVLASAVKMLYRIVNGQEKTVPPGDKSTISQELALLGQHLNLPASMDLASQLYRRFKVLYEGEFAAYHYTFSAVDAERADQFFEGLESGLDLSEGDAVYLLRERIAKELGRPAGAPKLGHWQWMTLLVTAWEATRSGRLTPKEAKLLKNGRPVAGVSVPQVSEVPWLSVQDEPVQS